MSIKDISTEDLQQLAASPSAIASELSSRGFQYGWYKPTIYAGFIYILVNPAFPALVKIGYADDIQKRLKSLNSNSGIPDPFHVYATYRVKHRLDDLQLHKLIDSLDPSLRHSPNKEFYEMTPQKAFSILSAIAQISGDEALLERDPMMDSFFLSRNPSQPSRTAAEPLRQRVTQMPRLQLISIHLKY